MGDVTYTRLATAQIQEGKNLVISECSKGGYTLAQQVTFSDSDKKMNIYLKGAIHLNSSVGLVNLRDALNIAIGKISEKN